MINLFNINSYIVDTSSFNNLLHGEIVCEFEEAFASYVGAKHACFANSASSLLFLSLLKYNTTIRLPSTIPPVVPNVVINTGNRVQFYNDINWVGCAYHLHENIFDNELYEGWYLTRKSILAQHESESVTITVYGNSNIHCGDVVEINIPKRTILESSTDVYNQYMSGKYIALNVRHSIVNIPEGNYMTIIDLIKDSFVNPIPDITNLETK